MRRLLAAALLCLPPALTYAGPTGVKSPADLHDTYLLKPPAGAALAVYEFEDLECPKCAHDTSLVHATCAKYGVPLVRKDYPWFFHAWAMEAAVSARYLQDHVSVQAADQFRADVFAAQDRIASREDLRSLTSRWYAAHHVAQPFSLGSGSKEAAEVQADHALGDKIGIHATPTILLVTAATCVKVPDATQLDAMLQTATRQTHDKTHARQLSR